MGGNSNNARVYSLPDGSKAEVFGPASRHNKHFTTGPVVGFLVDDVVAATEELRAADIPIVSGPRLRGRGYCLGALPCPRRQHLRTHARSRPSAQVDAPRWLWRRQSVASLVDVPVAVAREVHKDPAWSGGIALVELLRLAIFWLNRLADAGISLFLTGVAMIAIGRWRTDRTGLESAAWFALASTGAQTA
jgi:hypothetical protein